MVDNRHTQGQADAEEGTSKKTASVKEVTSETVISVKGVNKTYKIKGKLVQALKDVYIDIQKGEICGIIGMSGAGKSTLVRCMNFLEVPDTGTVTVLGSELGRLNRRELANLRRRTAMIFQHFNLLMQRTVVENVMFPLLIDGVAKAQARQRAEVLLAEVGLADKCNSYPVQLSGGQKQRVAIARALATDPQILLCDEATSALDPQSTGQILDILKEINATHGITIVVITHQMSVVRQICSTVAIMENGEIKESGAVASVFAHPTSDVGRRIITDGANVPLLNSPRRVRIIFNSSNVDVPVLYEMIMKYKEPVSVLFADTQMIGGERVGQMLLELPEDPEVSAQMRTYLRSLNIFVEEFKA